MSLLIKVAEQALHTMQHIEAVYRLNIVKETEPSAVLENLQKSIANLHQAIEYSKDFDGCLYSPTGQHSSGWYCYWPCDYCGKGEPAIETGDTPVENQELQSVTLNAKLADEIIKALSDYCNTGQIDCADDLLAAILYEKEISIKG